MCQLAFKGLTGPEMLVIFIDFPGTLLSEGPTDKQTRCFMYLYADTFFTTQLTLAHIVCKVISKGVPGPFLIAIIFPYKNGSSSSKMSTTHAQYGSSGHTPIHGKPFVKFFQKLFSTEKSANGQRDLQTVCTWTEQKKPKYVWNLHLIVFRHT